MEPQQAQQYPWHPPSQQQDQDGRMRRWVYYLLYNLQLVGPQQAQQYPWHPASTPSRAPSAHPDLAATMEGAMDTAVTKEAISGAYDVDGVYHWAPLWWEPPNSANSQQTT